jgi:hypothetical protein
VQYHLKSVGAGVIVMLLTRKILMDIRARRTLRAIMCPLQEQKHLMSNQTMLTKDVITAIQVIHQTTKLVAMATQAMYTGIEHVISAMEHGLI